MLMVTRRVIGSWRVLRPDGTRVPGQGTITFKPSVLIRDSNTNQIVVQDPIVVELDAQGAIDVQLQTTDQAGLNPTGWHWDVTEEITSLTVRRYQLELPAGGTFDLSAVEVPPTAVPLRPQDQYLKRIEVGPTTVVNPNQPPAVDQTTTNSVAELQFDLPRAPNVAIGNVTVGTPAEGPAASSSTTAQGDARFNFRLPRSRNVQAGTTSMVNPDQPAQLSTSEDGSGDLVLDLSVPRAAEFAVGTVTTFNPDQDPDVLTTVTDGDVALDFGLPRAAVVTVDTPASVVNPDQQPAVSSVTTDGDVEIQFTLPRAAEVTVDEPATVLNPDQQPTVGSTITDGDVEIAFSLPRAPAVTVDTPATVLNPDQQPAVSSTTTDGDVEIAFSLPAAPTFTVGDVTTVGPSTPASTTDVGTNGNIVLDFALPRGEKGWAPVLSIVADNGRRVFQVDDWVGGEGTKPATGDYVGATGLVSDIAEAVDVRGPEGPAGIGSLDNIADVNITSVVDGQILIYDDATGNWINKSPDTGDIAEGTNLYYTDERAEDAADRQIAAAVLDDLADTDVGSAASDDLLVYDGADWVPTDSPAVAKVAFETTSPPSLDVEGELAWDDMDRALAYRADGLVIDIGQENVVLIRNNTGSPLTKGTSVCVAGSSAQRLSVVPSDASVGADGCRTLGLVMADIPTNQFGFVSTFGLLRGVNTNAFEEGDELFISTTPGVLSATPAASPGRRVTVGYVVIKGTQGAIFVTIRRGLWTREIDDVDITDIQDGDILIWNDSLGVFENGTPPADLGDLDDVDVAGAAAGDVLAYDGTDWVPDSDMVRSEEIANIQRLTQAEYDNLTPDADTLYIVI